MDEIPSTLLPDGPEAPPAPALPPAAGRSEQPAPQAPLLADDPPVAIQEALRQLVREYELESDAVRRHKVRMWREAEEFWRGNQDIWYSEKDQLWHLPFPDAADEPLEPSYAINLYRPWGLSIIAALVQSPPKLQYLPVSAESQEDVATARAATRIAQLVERNNNLQTLRVRKAYYLWTQGIYATYVRYLVDGGQFGYHSEPVFREQTFEVLPDRFECANCGAYLPAREAGTGLLAGGPVACRQCGQLMGPDCFAPAETLTAPLPCGTQRVPNGAEKFDTYGPLYFKVPPQAQSQRDCYYLIQVEEIHQAVLRAAYPHKADQIHEPGSGGEDSYERIVRLGLADSGAFSSLPLSNLVTYKRAWLRPEAFWSHTDAATRDELLRRFPDGCRVEFAGDVFLQAAPENLDDCWVLCAGLPGVGIYRDPLGLDAISIQRQVNDSANLLAQHRKLTSAPPVLYDARYINGDALARKRMQPGDYVPVAIEAAGPQRTLGEMIFQPHIGVDPALWNDGERLAEVGQFITGALPSIFGGGMPNLKTAAAYSQSRDQAMGRLALVWKQMREAEAREMTLAVECFRRNRSDDIEIVVEGRAGAFQSEYVRLGEIRGNVVARPAADEDFPTSFSQIRDSLEQLLNSRIPELSAVVGAPVNRPLVQHYLGLPELVDPGEDNRAKQFQEIEALLATEPVLDPVSGELRPSIAPELFIDDHQIHVDTIRDWAVSDAGLQAKALQPAGYANVTAHLLAHLAALAPPPAAPATTGNSARKGAHE